MDDLTQLTDLNEKSILDVLNKRYQNDFIYTCIGDIIIATNPYKKLTLYGDQKKQEYKNLKGRDQHKPHIYIISDRAYQNLKCNQLNQCCVVSGESGAGKTESTKLLIEHIAFLCKHDSSNLNEQIIEVNPLLEAFGNAKTVINNNSSRFGKFIELVFDSNGQLEGAIISEYLLEKSRVVFHAPGEKNFHIFYYFFAGIDKWKQEANKLQSPEKHRIMADEESGKIYETAEKLNECKETWKKLLEVMMHIGFNSEEIDGIEALLTAIVHVADIKFMPHMETEGVFIEDDEAISLCAQLLQVNAETLVDSLIILKNKVGNENIICLKNESQANDGRDALAKALYGRLFIWIVSRINQLLAPKPSIRNGNSNTWIGILDIYGFENFANNSFEQLCINIANEQLQLFFNEHIFRMELNEYEREGLNGCDVQFVDNKPLLDLFFKSKDPPCILAILDEESKFPQGSDQTFIDKLISNLSKKPEFQTTKGQSNFFTIMHFAGPVIYNVVGFLEKNRDTLSENISDCLGNSDSYIVHELFSPMSFVQKGINNTQRRKQFRMSKMITNFEIMRSTRINSEGQMKRASIICTPDRISTISSSGTMRGKNSKTLATQFSDSLHGLIEKMFHAEPHFIRCIKPNSRKSSNQFNNEMVLAQLNYTGVLETVKIRKQGYSTRIVFPEFLHRYGVISGRLTSENMDGKHSEVCRKILEISKLDGWKIGHTKVFLKHYHVDNLNSVLSSVMESITSCQALWRGTISRRKLAALRARALVYREEIERMNLEMMDIGIKFYDALNHSLKKDQEVDSNQTKSTNDHKIHPVNKPTVRIKGDKANLLLNKDRNSPQPHVPPLWEPVINTSQTDPSYVFLKESLIKLNSLQKDIWCKLYLMEKNAIIGKLYIRDTNVILNDSEEKYTGKIIGINSKDFEHLNTEQSQDAIKKIGKGIQISKDDDGNVFITRMSEVEVHVIGGIDGILSLDRSTAKVFDIEKFKEKVSSLLKTKDSQSGKINVNLIARWSVFNFSIGGIYGREIDLPLWISIINIHALDLIGDEKVLQEFFKKKKLSTTELNKIKEVWSQLNFNRSY